MLHSELVLKFYEGVKSISKLILTVLYKRSLFKCKTGSTRREQLRVFACKMPQFLNVFRN